MSRITDITATVAIVSLHCADPWCPKCAARLRWSRRKGQRTGKPAARINGKEVMR